MKNKKLLKCVKSIEDFNVLVDILVKRVSDKKPISDNGMLDGMIVGFILSTKFSVDLFLGNEMGHVLDGTLQKLEHILMWVKNNESELSCIFNESKIN